MAVPNVEGITALLFVSGWVLGVKRGVIASVIASLLYFGLNPQGTFPPTLVAQILGMTTAPIAGGLLRNNELMKPMDRMILAIADLIVTLWFRWLIFAIASLIVMLWFDRMILGITALIIKLWFDWMIFAMIALIITLWFDRMILAMIALIVTLWFDLLTNLSFPLTAGLDMRGIVTTLILGIPFSLIHIGSNIAIFVLVVPLLINLVRRYRLT